MVCIKNVSDINTFDVLRYDKWQIHKRPTDIHAKDGINKTMLQNSIKNLNDIKLVDMSYVNANLKLHIMKTSAEKTVGFKNRFYQYKCLDH